MASLAAVPHPLSQPLPSPCHNPSPPPVTTPPLSLQEEGAPQYNSEVVTLLLAVLDTATATGQPPLTLRESRVSAPPSLPSGNSIRLVTLRLAIMLLGRLLGESSGPALHDHHIALVESIYESSILQLRLFYKARPLAPSEVSHVMPLLFLRRGRGMRYSWRCLRTSTAMRMSVRPTGCSSSRVSSNCHHIPCRHSV